MYTVSVTLQPCKALPILGQMLAQSDIHKYGEILV